MSANLSDIAFSVIIKNDGIDDIVFKTIMLKGEKGNSVARVEKTSTSGLVDTYTIYLTDGTAGGTFTVTNGNDINIDDTAVSYSKTWSSQKIKTELDALESETSGAIDALSDMIPKIGTIEDVATASFSDGADDVPVSELIVDIEPVQAGSGEPSPDNERPISGWTECNLTRCGANLFDLNKATLASSAYGLSINRIANEIHISGIVTDSGNLSFRITSDYADYSLSGKNYVCQCFDVSAGYTIGSIWGFRTATEKEIAIRLDGIISGQNIDLAFKISVAVDALTEYHAYKGDTATIPFAQTIYGGEYDANTGKVNDTYSEKINLSELGWNYQGQNCFYAMVTGAKTGGVVKSNKYKYTDISIGSTRPDLSISLASYYGDSTISIKDENYSDVSSFVASLSGADCTYELATPIEIDATPVQVKTLLNNNNIFADTGNIKKLVYFKTGSEAVAKMIEAYMRASE